MFAKWRLPSSEGKGKGYNALIMKKGQEAKKQKRPEGEGRGGGVNRHRGETVCVCHGVWPYFAL